MRTELSITELEAESVQMLPSRETLYFNTNWANVLASNSSMALNAGSINSWATSTATQNVNVTQLSN